MKASVIIPVYNAARHLRRCLDSICGQTFRDFEIVAVDDGSTDGSGRILDEYSASVPLRRLHRPNGGVSKARNAGLAVAAGDFVMFLDADDIVHPRLLEWTLALLDGGGDFAVFEFLKASDVSLEAACSGWSEDCSAPMHETLPVPAFAWFVENRRLPSPWQFVFRRSVLPAAPFAEDIVIYEDVPFVLGALARPLRGVWLRKQLYGYAIMEVSQSHNSPFGRRMTGIEAGMRLLRSQLDDRQWRLHARRNCAPWLLDLWWGIGDVPDTAARRCLLDELYDLIRRLRQDGLIRWRDFGWRRRLRLMPAYFIHRMGGG